MILLNFDSAAWYNVISALTEVYPPVNVVNTASKTCSILHLFNIALKMREMAFQRHNHVIELGGGVPPDPLRNAEPFHVQAKFSNFS